MIKPSPFVLFCAVTCLLAALIPARLSASGASVNASSSENVADSTGPALEGVTWLAGSAIEGGILIGRVASSHTLTLDGEPLPASADGSFIIGFHRDSDTGQTLVVTAADGSRQQITLTAAQRNYDIQRIDGLKRDHVTPPQDVLDRISGDSAAVRAARNRHDAGRASDDFLAGLDMPVAGRVTGVYGVQRILNGQPRQPHYGIDIAAARGTPVTAPAGGRVTLVRDLYFSGWTVLVTHGLGLNGAFLHLDSVAVAEGQEVARGEVIGTVGSTGRSTGPHLDWRLDWHGRRLDAALVRDQLASLAGDS